MQGAGFWVQGSGLRVEGGGAWVMEWSLNWHTSSASCTFTSGYLPILYELSFNLKDFWQRSLLHDLKHISSKDHAV